MSTRLPGIGNKDIHPGLVFDRGFRDTDATAKARHVERVADLARPADYRSSFDRWKSSLTSLRRSEDGSGSTQFVEFRTLGRLVIGLGAASCIETSVTLHKVYGVPYLPGSAIKGVARRFTRQALGDSWAEGSFGFDTLFGEAGDDDSFRGVVSFHDAFPTPDSWRLEPDTITVHHSKYYTAPSPAPPSDSDNPIPVPLLSVTGTFVLPLTGPLAWVEVAKKILALALLEGGIGAKTSIGYGRMAITEPAEPVAPVPSAARLPEASPRNPEWPEMLACTLTLPDVRPGQREFAKGRHILEDGRQIFITALNTTEGIKSIRRSNRGLGPARCELKHQGRGHYHAIKMTPLET